MATGTSSSEKPKGSARLTENTDPALDRLVREKLVTARIGLLLRAPFFGNWLTPIAGWVLRQQMAANSTTILNS